MMQDRTLRYHELDAKTVEAVYAFMLELMEVLGHKPFDPVSQSKIKDRIGLALQYKSGFGNNLGLIQNESEVNGLEIQYRVIADLISQRFYPDLPG